MRLGVESIYSDMRLTIGALLSAVVLLLASPASSEELISWRVKDAQGVLWDMTMPPLKYDHIDFDGTISVVFEDPGTLHKICAQANASETLGCSSLYSAGYCVIWMSKGLPDMTQKMLRLHEMAHCKGWPGDHPSE